MDIARHFTLDELKHSNTAQAEGIHNEPDAAATLALRALCAAVLDPLREALGKVITINCAYRGPALNKRVGGVANSQHLTGQAADIQAPAVPVVELFKLIIRQGLPYDQVIFEAKSATSKWVHVSHVDGVNRGEIRVAKFGPDGKPTGYPLISKEAALAMSEPRLRGMPPPLTYEEGEDEPVLKPVAKKAITKKAAVKKMVATKAVVKKVTPQPRAVSKAPATRVAIVTGAARGIGLAIAQWFLRDGWCVALIDNNANTLFPAADALQQPARVLALHADVSVPAQVTQAVYAVDKRFGRIDALVNNAGVAVFKRIAQTSFEEWRAVMATNLDGPFLCTQAVAPVMLRRIDANGGADGGGAVVNIASISGLRASTLRVAYGTSKAAIIHLTKQQAIELGNAGIRVNAVAPGPVETEMAKQVHDETIRRDYFDAIPLRRYGTTAEIANAVGYLCSPQAAYINGQVLAVDGGFDASGVGLPTLRRDG
jgi:meso-butanediol dehydrogenase / (S,S)-butanediol dehydrogenase / diacetyl reductase